jgi:hypothetical protein
VPRRFATILLLAWFAALATGSLEYLHNLQHAADDARLASAVATEPADVQPPHPLPHHDERNCDLHAQLHLALFATSSAPPLVFLGLLLAFLTLLRAPLISRLAPARIDCRGPPAF